MLEQDKVSTIANLPKLEGKKIIIIGDIGLDEYVMGQVKRISPEAPVPVLEVEEEELRLGLALNVAQNIISLGGRAELISIVGQDAGAEKLKELSLKSNILWEGVITDKLRPTTRKTRIMTGHHHIVRVDYELRKFISPEIESQLIMKLENKIKHCDGVILQDYAKGVVTPSLVQKVNAICKKNNKLLFVDPHRLNPGSFYFGVDLIKPNFDEALALSGLNYDEIRDHPDRILEVGNAVKKITGSRFVVMTRGKQGMTIFSDEKVTEVPTFARKVFDVTGAGDTVIAALTLGVVAGLNLEESCRLANYAAGVVVGKVGCVPCEINELKEYIESF
ncbi:MAG TPA: D-glycero-beta-D-manno-heptose-7-phosphate kinase [Pseudobdellovibrionaceae bacterium]|nr:D-glycero-beta-D-manno-heptose-7-phosphate kinase [Pseudobdellovibrionaceae bacterium]